MYDCILHIYESCCQPYYRLNHYPDSRKTITRNDGIDSHWDERWIVTQMAGDEVDQGTWGEAVTVPIS